MPGWAVHGYFGNYTRGRAEISTVNTTNMGDIFKLRGILEKINRWKSQSPIVVHSNILLSFYFVLIYCISIFLSLHFYEKSLFYLAPLEGTMTIWCFLAPRFKEARVAVCWLFDVREIVLDNSADECSKRCVVPKCFKIFQVKTQSHHDHNGPFFPLPKK